MQRLICLLTWNAKPLNYKSEISLREVTIGRIKSESLIITMQNKQFGISMGARDCAVGSSSG